MYIVFCRRKSRRGSQFNLDVTFAGCAVKLGGRAWSMRWGNFLVGSGAHNAVKRTDARLLIDP